MEHIPTDEANDYDKHLFDQFKRLHQKLYLDDKGELTTLFFFHQQMIFLSSRTRKTI